MKSSGTIILASASPRRSELMELAGIDCCAVPANICEDVLPGEQPADMALLQQRDHQPPVHRRSGCPRRYAG